MSTDHDFGPPAPIPDEDPAAAPGFSLPSDGPQYVWLPPVRQRFQHRYRIHIALFALTLFTTAFANSAIAYFWDAFGLLSERGLAMFLAVKPFQFFTWRVFAEGLWFAGPLLVILGSHEFGHYFLCRRHRVDATLPYFLPLPLPPSGTLGAVIRIREAFPSKEALFDIGIAGPIAGFVALLPFLWIGVGWSQFLPTNSPNIGPYELGDPLLIQAFIRLRLGVAPAHMEAVIHPMAFAAWWGMLATALNLMPFGQLDGGHIVYSLLGKHASKVSVATIIVALLLILKSFSWLSVTLMLLVMAFFLGVRHPRIVDEDTPLDPTRKALAVFALVMFILCFTPVPLAVFFGQR